MVDVTPYDRLPQVTLDGALPFQPGGLQFSYGTEFVSFQRSLRSGNFINEDGLAQPWYDNNVSGLDRAEGDRLHLEPGVSLPLNWSWGYLKPSLKYAYTQYDLDLDQRGRNQLQAAGRQFDDSQDRGLPIYSVDGGLYFDRDTPGSARPSARPSNRALFYLYVPDEEQDRHPDLRQRREPASAMPRCGATTASPAKTASATPTSCRSGCHQSLDRAQRLRAPDASVRRPDLLLRGSRGTDAGHRLPYPRRSHQSSVSPYALEYQYRFNRDWHLTADFNWDPDTHRTRSGSTMFHYQPDDNPNKVVNLGYRYRNDTMRYDQITGTWNQAATSASEGDPNLHQGLLQDQPARLLDHLADRAAVERDRPLAARLQPQPHAGSDGRLRVRQLLLEAASDQPLLDRLRRIPASTRMQTTKPTAASFCRSYSKGLGGVTGNQVESFLDQGIQGYREREDQAYLIVCAPSLLGALLCCGTVPGRGPAARSRGRHRRQRRDHAQPAAISASTRCEQTIAKRGGALPPQRRAGASRCWNA